ncbi:hypothetical protein QFZ33_002376 [Arthrobacter globiformis]|nr:hypothetical protein [Arthrobacter globiformis]
MLPDLGVSRARRPGRKQVLSDAELLCLAVAQHLLVFSSETRWIQGSLPVRHHCVPAQELGRQDRQGRADLVLNPRPIATERSTAGLGIFPVGTVEPAYVLRDGVDMDGFAPMSKLAAGLVMMELGRGESYIGTAFAVQGRVWPEVHCLLGFGRAEEPVASRAGNGAAVRSLRPDGAHTRFGFRGSGNFGHKHGRRFPAQREEVDRRRLIGGITVVWARGDDGQVHGFVDGRASRAEGIKPRGLCNSHHPCDYYNIELVP